jgi:hypothetical protein
MMDDDLYRTLFSPAVFGSEAVYTPSGGAPETIRGLFKRIYHEDLGVGNYTDTFKGRWLDLAAAKEKESIVIDGTQYYIHGPAQHDVRQRTTMLVLTEG